MKPGIFWYNFQEGSIPGELITRRHRNTYNPMKQVWGGWEKNWEFFDSKKILDLTRTMTWSYYNPNVNCFKKHQY